MLDRWKLAISFKLEQCIYLEGVNFATWFGHSEQSSDGNPTIFRNHDTKNPLIALVAFQDNYIEDSKDQHTRKSNSPQKRILAGWRLSLVGL